MKKVLAVLLAVTMTAVLLAGCGASSGSAPSAPAEATETKAAEEKETKEAAEATAEAAPAAEEGKSFEGVELVIASSWNESEPQGQHLVDTVNEWSEITGATVKINWLGRDILTAVKSDVLTGNPPDIFGCDPNEAFSAFVTEDEIMLEPLNDLFEMNAYGDDVPLKDILNPAYKLFEIDGNYYLCPGSFITSGFFYNKTLFKELGLEVPKTWDEFIAVCDAIKASGIPALAEDGNISFYNCYYFQALCQRILGSGKFCEAALDETGEMWGDPGFLKAAQLTYQLSKSGNDYFQEGYAGSAYPAAQSDWAMGGSGMIYCGTWIPQETRDLIDDDFEYGFFTFPTIEGGKADETELEAQLGGNYIFKDAKNKDAAKDFFRYQLSKAAQDKYVESSDNMGIRKDCIFPEVLGDVKPYVEASTSTYKNFDGAMAAAPEWWANVFYPLDDALLFGDITPEDFIARMISDSKAFYANKQ